jgi:DNA repair protein RecO (recombination protein O)
MPLYTADALVLRTYKLGEADRIVVFLTADRGKKRGVAKSARRPRSRFVGALEPLTHARVAYFEKETRELVNLNYAEPLRSPLLASGDAVSYASYFAELLDEWSPADDPGETLYRLGTSVLDAMTDGGSAEHLARYFEYWLLRLQGVYPSLDGCGVCGGGLQLGAVVLPREHEFVCRSCVPARAEAGGSLSSAALAFLRGAASTPPADVASLGLSDGATRELESAHRRLIATHLEKELKSVRVLRELR